MNLSTARHAFISGGASGIGLGMADALTARGIPVTIADVDAATLQAVVAGRHGRLRGQVFDTRDRNGWAVAKAESEAALGPVDILINNAGIAPHGREFADLMPEAFDRIIAINLMGVFNGVSCFAADLRARRRGHIVNTASMAGLANTHPGIGDYMVAKFGVVALSECLRIELEPHGVGVSVLCPGLVKTNLPINTAKLRGDLPETAGGIPDSAMSAAQVADKVIDGIARNLPYIITHPERWPAVEARMHALREAFLSP